MKILIRNLNRQTTQAQLEELFRPFGKITSVVLVLDPATGRSKGFGFVEMPNKEEAKKAIAKLNGKNFHGVEIRVKTTNSIFRGGRGPA